jgi:endonuclease/exonuclease/phosphatase family metal-dependent hydrolase
MQQEVKVLLGNIGYATGLDGTYFGYIRYANRFLYNPRHRQEEVLSRFRGMVEREQPDLVCAVEVDHGTVHTDRVNQIQCIVPDGYAHHENENKYSSSSFRQRIPFFGGKGNGFVSRNQVAFEKIYLSHGAKRLVYKIQVHENFSLYMVHFSLNYRTRHKQLAELAQIVVQEKNVVVCGDFNILSGRRELRSFLDKTGLRLLNEHHQKTFPAARPLVALDVFCASENVIGTLDIMPDRISDHLSVLATLSVQPS